MDLTPPPSPTFNYSPYPSSTHQEHNEETSLVSDSNVSKFYRIFMVLFLTSAFCYLLRTILYLFYHMVIPLVVIVVAYVFYVNGGLSSRDGYHSSMDSLTCAVREFLSGVYDIIEGIKNVVTR